jgi:RHS repeat-associated protein
MLFTGEQFDAKARPSQGLYYLRARYYDPGIGRFLTRDPVLGIVPLPSSQNRYVYVLNEPTSLTDPSGFCVFGLPCPKPIKKAGQAIGGFLGSAWGAPALCNPLTGPVGCAAAAWLNAPATAAIEWGLRTFSDCQPPDGNKEGGGKLMQNCEGLAAWIRKAIFSPPGYTVGDTTFVWDPNPALIQHEKGHLPQYDWLGDYFWPAYGLGAVTSFIVCGPDLECIHDRNFMEWWANR